MPSENPRRDRKSRSELLHPGVLRIPVRSPAQEARAVADPVARYVVERDLHDQLRAQPLPDKLLVGLPAARLPGAALVGPVGLQVIDQLALLLRLEARRVPDHVKLPVVVVGAEDQRADGALLLPEAERLYDEVRRAHALDLHHAGA